MKKSKATPSHKARKRRVIGGVVATYVRELSATAHPKLAPAKA